MYVRSYEEYYMEFPDYVAHKFILLYIPPVLLIIGTFGNVFAFIILIKNTKKASTYSYLSVLAVMDLMVLYIGLLRLWIGQFTLDIENRSDILCKVITFLGYVSSDSSVWIIIAVTIERTIVVMFPLQAPRICNVRLARIGIAAIISIFLAMNCHFLWSLELYKHVTVNETDIIWTCKSTARHVILVEEIWPWVDAAVYSFVPFLIILVLNILIIRQVFAARHTRSMLQQQHSVGTRNGCARNGFSRGNRRTQGELSRKITFMLLAVSFTFLITALPMNVVLIYTSFFSVPDDDKTFAKMRLINAVAELLMYTNHSVNFFLYCATGRKFRTQFKNMMCYWWSCKWLTCFSRKSRHRNGSFKLYKMNSTTTPRTIYMDCEPMHGKGTLL